MTRRGACGCNIKEGFLVAAGTTLKQKAILLPSQDGINPVSAHSDVLEDKPTWKASKTKSP